MRTPSEVAATIATPQAIAHRQLRLLLDAATMSHGGDPGARAHAVDAARVLLPGGTPDDVVEKVATFAKDIGAGLVMLGELARGVVQVDIDPADGMLTWTSKHPRVPEPMNPFSSPDLDPK
jgi:hypothetical protein